MVNVTLPTEFAWVIFAELLTVFVVNAIGFKVSYARRTYNVPYPKMYADENHADGVMFNCIQRAHQNTLEAIPFFLMTMLFAGIRFPVAAASLGLAWNIGKIGYAVGYWSGKPEKRNNLVSYVATLASLGLFGLAFATALYFLEVYE